MSNENFFKNQSKKYRTKKFKIIQKHDSCPDCECYGCYKHGECGTGCNNSKKQNHKAKPKRDYGFENWMKNAMNLYHSIKARLPEYPENNNTLNLIREGFKKNMDNYPRWRDTRSMVNIELDTISQILKELQMLDSGIILHQGYCYFDWRDIN